LCGLKYRSASLPWVGRPPHIKEKAASTSSRSRFLTFPVHVDISSPFPCSIRLNVMAHSPMFLFFFFSLQLLLFAALSLLGPLAGPAWHFAALSPSVWHSGVENRSRPYWPYSFQLHRQPDSMGERMVIRLGGQQRSQLTMLMLLVDSKNRSVVCFSMHFKSAGSWPFLLPLLATIPLSRVSPQTPESGKFPPVLDLLDHPCIILSPVNFPSLPGCV
jgi:hypothetical protein